MLACRQADRQTDRHIHHNTTFPTECGVIRLLGRLSAVLLKGIQPTLDSVQSDTRSPRTTMQFVFGSQWRNYTAVSILLALTLGGGVFPSPPFPLPLSSLFPPVPLGVGPAPFPLFSLEVCPPAARGSGGAHTLPQRVRTEPGRQSILVHFRHTFAPF